MSDLRLSDVKAAAESLSGISITDDDAISWADLGQVEIASVIHPSRLPYLVATAYLPSGGYLAQGADSVAGPSDFLRFVQGRLQSSKVIPLTRLPYDEYSLRTGYGNRDLTINHLLTAEYGGIIYFNPSAPAGGVWRYQLQYVKFPATITAINSTLAIGRDLKKLLADYLILQAQLQDEEFEQYAVLLQKWQAEVAALGGPR